ncbi:hypothetical protein [Priestia filamentosa]|uniref:hypothetical protein n=1 Tax=Priestia filamentosa TaxID=1402861 RepID=UPI002E213C65|nr:hypothetical protein [Priestia filamentosa]
MHHPMVLRRGIKLPNLTHNRVFIEAGENDLMCTAEESKEIYDLLEKAGANVQISWLQQGHHLTVQEVREAAKRYEES